MTDINNINQKLKKLNLDYKEHTEIKNHSEVFESQNANFKTSRGELQSKIEKELSDYNKQNLRFNNFITDKSIYENSKPDTTFPDRHYQNTSANNYSNTNISNTSETTLDNPMKRDTRDCSNNKWNQFQFENVMPNINGDVGNTGHNSGINNNQLEFINSLNKPNNNSVKNDIYAQSNSRINDYSPLGRNLHLGSINQSVANNNQTPRITPTMKEIQNQRLNNLTPLARNINLPVSKGQSNNTNKQGYDTCQIKNVDDILNSVNTQSQAHLNTKFK